MLKAAATAEARGWKAWEDKAQLVSRPAQGQGHEGAGPEPGARSPASRRSASSSPQDWLKKAGADGQAIVDAYKKM